MSGSDTGLIVGLQQQQQQQHNNIRMPFTSPDSTAVYKPNISAATSPTYQSSGGGGGDGSPGGVMVSMAGAGGAGEPMVKRKRGRPRKYGPDGTMALGLSPTPPSVTVTQSAGGGGGFSSPLPTAAVSGGGGGGGGGPTSSLKKARGRPPGSSSKKQQFEAFGSAGFGFTPHVITVKAGEDVSSKIMSFSQHGPRAVCVLSANGAISNVTLRQPATSGGTVTYEGRYEILSLSGSFLLSENGGQRSRTGGLSVSLSGTDGRVLGGGVAGLLTAASPVQVVVGSFIADGRKEPKSANRAEPSPTFGLGGGGTAGPNSPPSRGTLSESSGGPGSPINQSTGACNNNSNPQGMSGMPWK